MKNKNIPQNSNKQYISSKVGSAKYNRDSN